MTLHKPTACCSIMQTLTKYEDYGFTVCDAIKYSTVFLNLWDFVGWVGCDVSKIIISSVTRHENNSCIPGSLSLSSVECFPLIYLENARVRYSC
jgi:hypothetical protein